MWLPRKSWPTSLEAGKYGIFVCWYDECSKVAVTRCVVRPKMMRGKEDYFEHMCSVVRCRRGDGR